VDYRWTCSRCGEEHEELPLSWSFDTPDYWNSVPESERDGRGWCNEDFCEMIDDGGDAARFVRGTIDIPILDAADESEAWLTIGVWSSLSESSFEEVVAVQERDDGSPAGPWFGWLSNSIPVYPETLNLETMVHYRQGLRPFIEVKPGDHPLAQDAAGITLARATELAEHWHHLVNEG
jgi:hypothetical protein